MLCSGSVYNPVWWSLYYCRILYPFLGMLTYFFQIILFILHRTSLLLRCVIYAIVLGVGELLYLQISYVVVPVCMLLLIKFVCWIMMRHKWCVWDFVRLYMDHLAWYMCRMLLYLLVQFFRIISYSMGLAYSVYMMIYFYFIIPIVLTYLPCSCYPDTVFITTYQGVCSILFLHVSNVPFYACLSVVDPHKFEAVGPTIPCWVKLRFVVIGYCFLTI